MSADTIATLGDASVKAKLETIGVIVAPSTSQELGNFIKSEIAKWEAVIKNPGSKSKADVGLPYPLPFGEGGSA